MERHQEIERTIIKTYRAHLWAPFVKALKEFQLLKPKDKVCVCISGGKDSMLLAKLFQELKRHSDFEFEVTYLVMNPGYNERNLKLIQSNLNLLHIDAIVKNTDIFEIANAQTKTPCYLCAKMRRGALYKLAKELGCNKIALGHHFDDVIETILMGMFYGSQIQTMMPKLHSTNFEGMELIRPMYLIEEKDIIQWMTYNHLKFIQCACRFTEDMEERGEVEHTSKREEMKNLLKYLEAMNPNVKKNVFKSVENVNLATIIAYSDEVGKHHFLDTYNQEGE